MKKLITLLAAVAILLLFVAPQQIFGQPADTLWINAHPAGNINAVINGDTTSTGQRAHPNRVYALYRDSLYLYTATMNINGNITVVGPSGTGRPPVIAPSILSDNSSPNTFFSLNKKGSVGIFKNLYFLDTRPDQGYPDWGGAAIKPYADSVTVRVDSVIFDAMLNDAISPNGVYDKFFVSDCEFRNSQHPTSWFAGDGLLCESGPTDSVVMVNNTFFYQNSYAFVITAYNKYFDFEHNTIFLNLVNPLNIFLATNAVIKNNIFYSTESEASDSSEMSQEYYENYPLVSGIISLDTAITGIAPGVTNKTRVAVVDNNSYFWPKVLTDFYTAYNDTVTKMETVGTKTVRAILYPSVWMNSFTQAMFNDHTDYPGLSASGNVNADPGFDSTALSQINKMIQFIQYTKEGKLGSYLWQFLPPSGVLFPPTWPLPENLAYSNTSLQTAGTDGFALGDLNWYPSQHQQWLASRTTGIKTLRTNVPSAYTLDQNYPNPFNPSTIITYSIPKEGNVELKVYNVLGEIVSNLVNKFQTPGSYEVSFNASNLSSGVYFYTLKVGNVYQVKKMMLLK
jgi:Secretion system C-terminal sorting domain